MTSSIHVYTDMVLEDVYDRSKAIRWFERKDKVIVAHIHMWLQCRVPFLVRTKQCTANQETHPLLSCGNWPGVRSWSPI